MSPSLPIPDFQDAPQNLIRDEIFGIIEKIKIKYDPNIIGMISYIPIFFDFGSIFQYKPSDRITVLRSVKTNFLNIAKQAESSLEKMDAINKPNIHLFITRIVIQNVPGKSGTSKKSTFYPDGTLEIQTVFEDSLNCQYYLEKKIIQTLNEFRPSPGSEIPVKIPAADAPPVVIAAPVAAAPAQVQSPASFTPTPIPAQAPVTASVIAPNTAQSAQFIDLSIPTYPNGAWETLKLDIVNSLKPIKIDNSILPGPPFDAQLGVDWASIQLSGPDFNTVLRSMKTNIPNISKQIVPAIQKLEDFRKPMIADFMVSIVFQNVAGKQSTSKKAFLSAEGALIIQVPFEDALNCSYYFEKKITSGLQEFAPPNSAPNAKITSPVVEVPPPVVVAAPVVPVSQPTYSVPQPTYQQPKPAAVYVPHYSTQPQPVAPTPAPAPAPVVVPIVKEPPKPKGRAEMEFKPTVDDFNQLFLIREIDYFLQKMVIVDEKDQPFGVPIYVDWASIMVYPSAIKQNTIIRNVNLAIYRLLRDIVVAVKMACTDFGNRDNVVEYLRSITIQNMQGNSSSLKKVVYEDGHLIIQTIFEDFGNCGLYFDSKVIQALQSRPSTPTPKKPEALVIIKEEVDIRYRAHKSVINKDGQQYTPSCDVECDWASFSQKAYEGTNIENNIISLSNNIFIDLHQAILSYSKDEIEILLREITHIKFSQATPGKTIFDKRTTVMADNGVLTISTTFEDRNEGFKTFKEKLRQLFTARLYKVEIRDKLVPALKEMIDLAVKIQYKSNYLDNIPVTPFTDYSSKVIFDWQVVDKESLENQVNFYKALTDSLKTTSAFAKVLDGAIRDICSYDVGKNEFINCTTFILRDIIRAKEEVVKNTTPSTWEFSACFHGPQLSTTKQNLTTLFKETLLVAFPCAIQDTFPLIDELVEDLESSTGKKVPVVINYDSWRNDQTFRNEETSYKYIKDIAVNVPRRGLVAIMELTKDQIVKDEYTKKVNKIIIVCDTSNKVQATRSKDPNVLAKLVNGELTFTLNFRDAAGAVTKSWDYQLELMLQTRPLKIQRAINKAKMSLDDVTKKFSALIGKQVPVSVDYQGFINDSQFIVNLEEEVYTKVITSFAHLLTKGWIDNGPAAELLTYDTVKKSIQNQMNSLKFVINCESTQREDYEFSFDGTEFIVGLNLNSACKVTLKEWRLDMERMFKLRDLRLREEIAVRVDLTPSKKAIDAVIGRPIQLEVDWESLIRNADFLCNLNDYCKVIHVFSEDISKELSTKYGLGRCVEYTEIQAHVQNNLSKIIICAGNSLSGVDISYDKSSKTLKVAVGIKVLYKQIQANSGDYESYGRQIENVMNLRMMMIQGYIKRNNPSAIEDAKSRLKEAVEMDVNLEIEWSSIIDHPSFNKIVEFVPVLKNIVSLSAQLNPLVKLCRENFNAKSQLQPVSNYTIIVDGDSRIDESEFDRNKFGVDWAKVSWKAPPARDHIVVTVNLAPIIKTPPHDLSIEDKIEFLVTPDKAIDRFNRKEDLEKAERRHNEQMRADRRMADAADERNRELERLNRNLTRRW
ncbi:hypothetical protein RB653_010603 [Dictyostelium firmibasis]|uniref:Uncharacterized protein n=1 Tax=Dictyostelium firmibasis TaxID=79012 RepID=A0AAN7YW34_9MYCE